MSAPLAHLASGPRGERIQAVFLCACGSLDIVARGMCHRCLTRQHYDQEHFGGRREAVLKRDHWTCQGCFYRPAQQDRDEKERTGLLKLGCGVNPASVGCDGQRGDAVLVNPPDSKSMESGPLAISYSPSEGAVRIQRYS